MIAVFTRTTLQDVTPEALAAGIGERLAVLTALYCPLDEERPEVVLERMRITPAPGSERGFGRWHVRYGRAHNALIAVARTACESSATAFRWSGAENVAHAVRIYSEVEPRGLREVGAVLEHAHDVASITMTKRAAQRMAWPVGVAAAAWLAARGDGVVFAPGSGWLMPTPTEARPAK